MANRVIYALVAGKPAWLNSNQETVDFAMVNVGADPTANTHVVRKGYADTTYSAVGHTHTGVYIAVADKGAANGVAPLDANALISPTYLPSYVDDVLEFADLAAFPVTGETGKIYIALDTNKSWRWSGSTYVEIVASPGTTDNVTEGTVNKYFTEARVRSTVLTGLSTASGGAIVATDSILAAFGKLEFRVALNDAKVTYSASTARTDLIAATIVNGDTTHAPTGDAVFDALALKADTGHAHAIADVTGLQTALDSKVNASDATSSAANDNAAAITVRQAVYLKASGSVDLARANAIATCGDVVGFVADASIDAAANGLITFKPGEKISGFSGLTPGATYYVSAATAGDITSSAPAPTVGNVIKQVGLAISTSVLMYLPGPSVEVLS